LVTAGACSRAWRVWRGWRDPVGSWNERRCCWAPALRYPESSGTSLMPYWQAHHDACEAAARGGLDAARYRACWEEGFALGRGQQVAAALEDTVPAGRRAPTASAVHDEGELSTRELEVARLVANGLSNPRDRRRPVRVGGDGQDARVPHPREARLGVSRAARELGRRPRPRSTHPGRPVGVWPQIHRCHRPPGR
jgi:hypothetical protein